MTLYLAFDFWSADDGYGPVLTHHGRVTGMNHRIGIITIPLNKSGVVPLSNLIDILSSCSPKLHLISGDAGIAHYSHDTRVVTHEIRGKPGRNSFEKILNHATAQIGMARHVLRVGKNVDLWILFMGAETLVIPHIVGRLLGRTTVLLLSGSFLHSHEAIGDSTTGAIACASRINHTMANRIVVYSKNNVEQWRLGEYRHKITVAHRHFVNLSRFPMVTRRASPPVIGCIGRLSREKGVMNLIESVPTILARRKDLRFKIVGDGPLRGDMEEFISRENLKGSVEMLGWVDHDEIPAQIASMSLLVIPSYTEGLSNVALEAMASGIPVLATMVGGMPDIITHNVTGFKLENNDPASITDAILRYADAPESDSVAAAARRLVESEFRKDVVEQRWMQLIDQIIAG